MRLSFASFLHLEIVAAPGWFVPSGRRRRSVRIFFIVKGRCFPVQESKAPRFCLHLPPDAGPPRTAFGRECRPASAGCFRKRGPGRCSPAAEGVAAGPIGSLSAHSAGRSPPSPPRGAQFVQGQAPAFAQGADVLTDGHVCRLLWMSPLTSSCTSSPAGAAGARNAP